MYSGTSFVDFVFSEVYSKNVNQGDFGWHPESILIDRLGSMIPIEYAFSSEPGTLGPPLYDEESYKQLGYWLLRVVEKYTEEEAEVQAVFLSSEEEAVDIKTRLEAGEELGPIAEEYSDYSLSRDLQGELGLVPLSDNISDAFNGYVYDPAVEIGVWSEPIQDEAYWSQGGSWVVFLVDKDDDRELSEEDRNYLRSKIFDSWLSRLWSESAAGVDHSNLTAEIKQWVIERIMEE